MIKLVDSKSKCEKSNCLCILYKKMYVKLLKEHMKLKNILHAKEMKQHQTLLECISDSITREKND